MRSLFPVPSSPLPAHDGAEVSTAKKVKSKPQVQSGVDLAALASAGSDAAAWKSVNVVTLSAWLTGKGVAVKSKDKKPVLVKKVYEALGPHGATAAYHGGNLNCTTVENRKKNTDKIAI